MRYEKLLEDLDGELRRILSFLGVRVEESLVKCAVERKEGLFNRDSEKKETTPRKKVRLESVTTEEWLLKLEQIKKTTFQDLGIPF